MGLFLLSLAVIAAVMLAMAVGVLFNYPCPWFVWRARRGRARWRGAVVRGVSEPSSSPHRVGH